MPKGGTNTIDQTVISYDPLTVEAPERVSLITFRLVTDIEIFDGTQPRAGGVQRLGLARRLLARGGVDEHLAPATRHDRDEFLPPAPQECLTLSYGPSPAEHAS